MQTAHKMADGSYVPCCNSKPLSLLEQKQVGAGLGSTVGGDFGFHSSFVEEAKKKSSFCFKDDF